MSITKTREVFSLPNVHYAEFQIPLSLALLSEGIMGSSKKLKI